MEKIVTLFAATVAVIALNYLHTNSYHIFNQEVAVTDSAIEHRQQPIAASTESHTLTVTSMAQPQQSKASETNISEKIIDPTSFTMRDGTTEVLNTAPLSTFNDLDKFDAFGQKILAQNEPRSDQSIHEELRLKEFLQEKVLAFKNAPVRRFYCTERYCVFVAAVKKEDELFAEFMKAAQKNEFGSGGFFNFESNGEKFNSVIVSLQPGQSVAL